MDASETPHDRIVAVALVICGASLLIGLGGIADGLRPGAGSEAESIGQLLLLVSVILFIFAWVKGKRA